MTTRTALFRAWCVQAWRCILQATQAMAVLDLTGQFTGCGIPQYPVVDMDWAHCTHRADETCSVLTGVPQQAMTDRPRVFTPTKWTRLRILRDHDQENSTPFTSRELAHLRFVRWLHQSGRAAS